MINDLNNEEWFDIPGYEGIYQVNMDGLVRNERKNKLVKQHTGNKGYQLVRLYNGCGESKQVLVHRIIASVFVENPNPKYTVVKHKDGDKKNNKISNLEWTTIGRNVAQAWGKGLNDCRGEKNGRAKIKETDVIEIRKLYAKGVTVRELMDMYPLSKNAMNSVVKRITWKHLD